MNEASLSRRRGQPLAILALILLSYAGMRVTMWETPFAQIESLAESLPELFVAKGSDDAEQPVPSSAETDVRMTQLAGSVQAEQILSGNRLAMIAYSPLETQNAGFSVKDGKIMAGHNLLFMVGLAELPVTPAVAAVLAGRQPERASPTETKPDRWSMDGWLFLRQSSPSSISGGARPASYGGSQAGAVLRYRLAPSSGRKPTAYVRATRNLRGVAETELAAGFSARPISRLPIAAHVELRGRSQSGSSEVKPVAFLVSELPPVQLPLNVQAEAYAQAGYVGGDFATGFADGQIRASREVVRLQPGSLRAGAGVWGGAQRGVARLDIGPSASANFRIGQVNSRAQIDYRMRVAGDAEPGNGIAFTLSTGF